jgi:hypothetical protein
VGQSSPLAPLFPSHDKGRNNYLHGPLHIVILLLSLSPNYAYSVYHTVQMELI